MSVMNVCESVDATFIEDYLVMAIDLLDLRASELIGFNVTSFVEIFFVWQGACSDREALSFIKKLVALDVNRSKSSIVNESISFSSFSRCEHNFSRSSPSSQFILCRENHEVKHAFNRSIALRYFAVPLSVTSDSAL